MSSESHITQEGANARTAPFWPDDRKTDLILWGLSEQGSMSEPAGEAGVSPANHDDLDAEYFLMKECIKMLEEENASLRMRVQILQELCLLD